MLNTAHTFIAVSRLNLFRSEAVRLEADHLGREIHWNPPGHRVGVLLLVLVFLSAAGLVLGLHYADRVTASGYTQSRLQPLKVLVPEKGRVHTVFAQVGDRVRAHQKLARFDRDLYVGEHVSARLLEEQRLRSVINAARAERVAFENLQRQRRDELDARHRALEARHERLSRDGRIGERRMELARNEQRRAETLVSGGWLSASHLEQRLERSLAIQDAYASQNRQRLQLTQDIAAARQALDVHDADSALQQARFVSRIGDLAAQLARVRSDSRFVVLAPRDGEISEIYVEEGQQVVPGAALFTLVDPNPPLHVRLYLPARGAARVQPGMPLRLRFAGYPETVYGSGTGTIERVARSAHDSSPEPVYLARAVIRTLPTGIEEVPVGMAVSADIIIESQPLWRWLLKPVRNALDRL